MQTRPLPALILWVLTFWLGLPVAGQAQLYYVDLSTATLVLPNLAVHVEQVLDARARRAGIGTVHRGLNNVRQSADLRPSVPQALTAWLHAQLPARPTDHAIVLVVRQLQLAEEINVFSEKATVELSVDVYAHLADGYYYVLNAAELVESRGMETTAQHPTNLALAFQRCLAQCQTIDWEKLPPQPARTLAELQQVGRPAAAALRYPALVDSVRPKGYYPTFLAFRNNQPVTEPALSVRTTPRTAKGWEGTLEVEPTVAAATGAPVALRDAWGFSDGQQVYIWHKRHYQPLTRAGDSFHFVGFNGPDPGAVGTAGFLGGAAGGAIAAVATSGKPADFTLDMVTGAVSPFAEASGAAAADTAMIYVYRRASNSPGPVQVLLNGKVVAELDAHQFAAIPYTDKVREVSLCLQTAPGRCTAFIPTFGTTSYVEIARDLADPANPLLERVAVKKGVFDLRVIRARTK
ncbi:hypothetical protein I2I05_04470 [Hymenobacter sp. BT683]|uniref:DUF4384 domain-containing protein n=1 Tax=Hymenobacter jeongseonensis TaxID=2791027 RepID=A0ABS0IE68_9BACT|nr:hypothetical protein [Hymenobacter jeongseonensis]MBF9236643.1 hypothetical protein [Hymenobacter jeongseonensis]